MERKQWKRTTRFFYLKHLLIGTILLIGCIILYSKLPEDERKDVHHIDVTKDRLESANLLSGNQDIEITLPDLIKTNLNYVTNGKTLGTFFYQYDSETSFLYLLSSETVKEMEDGNQHPNVRAVPLSDQEMITDTLTHLSKELDWPLDELQNHFYSAIISEVHVVKKTVNVLRYTVLGISFVLTLMVFIDFMNLLFVKKSRKYKKLAA